MRYLASFLIVLLFSGCVTKQIPPKIEYKLDRKTTIHKSDAKQCQGKTLQIAKAYAPNYLMQKQMNYVENDFIQNVYSESQWTLSPSSAISMEFLQALEDTKLFKSVQSVKSRSKNDYILELRIEDFLQYFEEAGKTSYVNAKIALTLLDYQGHIVAGERFMTKIPTKELNAKSGVQALNEALEHIIQDSIVWLEKGCK